MLLSFLACLLVASGDTSKQLRTSWSATSFNFKEISPLPQRNSRLATYHLRNRKKFTTDCVLPFKSSWAPSCWSIHICYRNRILYNSWLVFFCYCSCVCKDGLSDFLFSPGSDRGNDDDDDDDNGGAAVRSSHYSQKGQWWVVHL